ADAQASRLRKSAAAKLGLPRSGELLDDEARDRPLLESLLGIRRKGFDARFRAVPGDQVAADSGVVDLDESLRPDRVRTGLGDRQRGDGRRAGVPSGDVDRTGYEAREGVACTTRSLVPLVS